MTGQASFWSNSPLNGINASQIMPKICRGDGQFLELTGTLLQNSFALSQFCLFLPDTTGASNISWSTGSIRNTFSCCVCGESELKFINYKHF